MGQDTLLHGETLLIIPATDSDYIAFPFFTQSVSSNFCGHTRLVEGTKFSFIVHFNELLAASGRERDVQLHSEVADSLRGATKKSKEELLKRLVLLQSLLLGRKVMTNLDSILKSRDITLPTKVHLVKAMVFPVVMYGCERWTIKKAERQRIDAFELWCWRRLLRVPWTARRSN